LTPPVTLADSSLDEQVPLACKIYLDKLGDKRRSPRTAVYDKDYFLMPCMTDVEVGTFEHLPLKTDLQLTDMLFSKIYNVEKKPMIVDRKLDVDAMDKHLTHHNRCFLKLLSLVNHDRSAAKMLKMTTNWEKQQTILLNHKHELTDELRDCLQDLNEAKDNIRKEVNEPTRQAYKNRIQVSKGFYKTNWPPEMEHFNQEKGDHQDIK